MSNYDEDRAVFNGTFELEILIDRPAGQVWQQFVDVKSWVTSHEIDEVAGPRGTAGSIIRVSPRAKMDGTPPPHYHYCKLVKVVPERQYVLKTYSERGGSYGMQMTAFDDTRFVALGSQTKVIFNVYVEMRGEAVAKDPAAMNLDGSRENMTKNLEALKRLVER